MIHLVKHNDSVLTYCGLPIIENDIEYITLAQALDYEHTKPFDCVECHKNLSERQRHSQSED